MRILLLIILMTLSACATTQQAVSHDPQAVLAEIEPGDWVEVIKRDGEEVAFRVTEVTDTGIVGAEGMRLQGRQHDIAYTDMQALTVRRVDGKMTALGWAVGLVLLPAMVPWPAFPISGGH
jgi:hypothetical protein